MDPVGLISLGFAALSLLPYIKRLAKKKEVREQLAGVLGPILDDLEGSMERLNERGKRLSAILDRVSAYPTRPDADELGLAWAETTETVAEVVHGLHRLASRAGSLAHFEGFMERLKEVDPAVYDLVQLLERSYQEGVLDVEDFPTFIELHPLKPKTVRRLKGEVEEAVEEGGPRIKKAQAIRIRRRFGREAEHRVRKAFKRLGGLRDMVRKLDPETAARMNEAAPEWARPLIELEEQIETR